MELSDAGTDLLRDGEEALEASAAGIGLQAERVGQAAGCFLDDSALRRRCKAARARASLRPLRFHDLRHTFGTHAIRTADPRELQEWMGHADFATTEIYLSYKPRAEAARRLAAAFATVSADGAPNRGSPEVLGSRPVA